MDQAIGPFDGGHPSEIDKPQARTSPSSSIRLNVSSSSRSSTSSSNRSCVSSIVLKQKAEHEAAKVRLEFMEKEVEIIKLQAEQQAEMEVSLKLLQ